MKLFRSINQGLFNHTLISLELSSNKPKLYDNITVEILNKTNIIANSPLEGN